jgi:hypothetical protein
MTRLLFGLALACLALATGRPAQAADAALTVEGTTFVLVTPDARLTSKDLVGAEFDMVVDGAPSTIRIDAVVPSKEQPGVLLHSFSVKDPDTGQYSPLCDADAYGREAGFPVEGAWNDKGEFVKDPKAWFLTCTSGSQGKCILWGYDPWKPGPKGEDLVPYYEACQHTVRADYDGRGQAFTKNGTTIDVFDDIGIQKSETGADAKFAFEAGWSPTGAVCADRTRWPDLLTLDDLRKRGARFQGGCDLERAKKRGALIFTRVEKR